MDKFQLVIAEQVLYTTKELTRTQVDSFVTLFLVEKTYSWTSKKYWRFAGLSGRKLRLAKLFKIALGRYTGPITAEIEVFNAGMYKLEKK